MTLFELKTKYRVIEAPPDLADCPENYLSSPLEWQRFEDQKSESERAAAAEWKTAGYRPWVATLGGLVWAASCVIFVLPNEDPFEDLGLVTPTDLLDKKLLHYLAKITIPDLAATPTRAKKSHKQWVSEIFFPELLPSLKSIIRQSDDHLLWFSDGEENQAKEKRI